MGGGVGREPLIQNTAALVNFWKHLAIFSALRWARNLNPICVTQNCPWASFMFPSLLPQTTRSTPKTAPKLVDFCVCKSYFKNVVNSGATSLCGQLLN